jgi:hypothetical protein
VPWARSFLRLMRVPDPAAPLPFPGSRGGLGRLIPKLEGRETPSALELSACMWLSVMEKCLAMQRRGIPLFVARYEELNAAPREVLMEMFAYCGLSSAAVADLDTVREQDSQAGSPLSRASAGEAPVQLSQENSDQLCQYILDLSEGLTADTILPGTYFPESRSG